MANVDPRLLALAERTQVRHAELIELANTKRTAMDRLAVYDTLNALRRSFRDEAFGIVGLASPQFLDVRVPDHAFIVAIHDDIEDSMAQLKALASQAVLYKTIKSVGGYGGSPSPWGIPDWVIALVVILVVVNVLSGLKNVTRS